MKLKLLSILGLGLVLSLASCGGASSQDPTTGAPTEAPTEVIPEGHAMYKVTVLKPDAKPLTGVKVQLCNATTCLRPVEVDENGVYTQVLEADTYNVHLQQLPEIYEFDENEYVLTPEQTEVTVTLKEIAVPSIGNGKSDDRYIVRLGTYKTEIKSAEDIVYYGFEALVPGIYNIKSLSKDLDTVCRFYSANDHFTSPDPLETSDDISETDKNFSYDFKITSDNFYVPAGQTERVVGARWTLGVSVKNVTNFPVSFPVQFTLKEALDDEPEIVTKSVEVQETLTQYPEAPENSKLEPVKMDGQSKIVLNTADGFYHVGSKTGPVLVAKISQPCLYIDTSLTHISDSGNRSLVLDGGESDYNNFIQEYGKYCNLDGVYGMTKELKIFFTKFAAQSKFFSSGWITSEKVGYTISPNAKWLIAAFQYVAL